MSRVASQGDLFRPAQPRPPPEPEPDPAAQLAAMLQELRAASVHPWTPLSEAVEREHQALHLGRLAGPEGERLAAAVLAESERLFAAAEAV